MPYQKKFLKLVVSGSLYAGERFSYTMSLIEDFGTPARPEVVPPALISAVSAFHAIGQMSSAVKVDEIKLNEIGTDGLYTQEQTVLHTYTTPVAGTGTPRHAPSAALAVTLETGVKRGLAARGRFYLPSPAMSISTTTGVLNAGDVTTLGTAVSTYLDAIGKAVPGYDLGVVSRVGAGQQRFVTAFKIGHVLDVISSRRAQLPEAYSAPVAISQASDT